MDKKVLLSEPKASFNTFPFFCDAQIMLKRSVSTPQGRVYGRLFWITFFGEAKKVIGCRATPDQQTVNQQKTAIKKHT
jgi:hypothetical protein